MRIIVTGGAGFIGSHFADTLLAAGHDLLVVDDLSSGHRKNLADGVCLEVGDFASTPMISRMRDFEPEAIFHFAAQISVPKSILDPMGDAQTNLLGTLGLLELAREQDAYFVFASSGGAIYGEAEHGPQTESHPEFPLNPYGVAKLAIDKYLNAYHHQYGFRFASMRFANVYGPRQGSRGEGGVVSVFMKKLQSRESVVINGDGLQTRDFVFVGDLAAIAPRLVEQRPTGVFNLGTGLETSVLGLFETTRRLFPKALPARHGPALPGEQRRSVLCADKVRAHVGWQATTNLDQGLVLTQQWFATHGEITP